MHKEQYEIIKNKIEAKYGFELEGKTLLDVKSMLSKEDWQHLKHFLEYRNAGFTFSRENRAQGRSSFGIHEITLIENGRYKVTETSIMELLDREVT